MPPWLAISTISVPLLSMAALPEPSPDKPPSACTRMRPEALRPTMASPRPVPSLSCTAPLASSTTSAALETASVPVACRFRSSQTCSVKPVRTNSLATHWPWRRSAKPTLLWTISRSAGAVSDADTGAQSMGFL